jgi:hypothetical protein
MRKEVPMHPLFTTRRSTGTLASGAFLLAALLVALFPNNTILAANDDLLLLTIPALRPPQSASREIGPAGGSLTVGASTVAFPAASFDAPIRVSLGQKTPQTTYGLTPDGMGYTLTMDDACLRQQASIRLQVGGADRQVAMAMAESLRFADETASANLPEIVVGTVSGGVLTLTLPASAECPSPAADQTWPSNDAPLADVPTKRAITFWAISGFRAETSTHFYLVYPIGILGESTDYPQLILNAAESAYDKLCAMGFDFAAGFAWPFRLNIITGMGEHDGLTAIPLSGKRYQYIDLNAALCATGKENDIKATVGHEFFHAVQNLYDPRSAIAIRNTMLFDIHYLWLSEASSVWFEASMLNDANYASPVFLKNTAMASHGLETGTSAGEIQNIGYWASGFLRYLRQDRGTDAFILDLWNAVRGQGTGTAGYSDLRALMDTAGGATQLAAKWTTFSNLYHTRNTGYANWEMPPGDRIWLAAVQPAADLATDVTPFSNRKLLFSFNTTPAATSYVLSALTPSANLTHALYKGTSRDGPFENLGNLRYGFPLTFTPARGDLYLVSVTNTDTMAPYTAVDRSVVHIGPQSVCAFCEEVPTSAVYSQGVYAGSAWRYWRPSAGSSNYYAAALYYDSAAAKPKQMICNWPTTYTTRSETTYYESGSLERIAFWDTNSSGHGTWLSYFDGGVLWSEIHYDHGLKNGPWLVNQASGLPSYRGNYANDMKNGTFIKYNTAGTAVLTCVYANDELQSGPAEACWQEFYDL